MIFTIRNLDGVWARVHALGASLVEQVLQYRDSSDTEQRSKIEYVSEHWTRDHVSFAIEFGHSAIKLNSVRDEFAIRVFIGMARSQKLVETIRNQRQFK